MRQDSHFRSPGRLLLYWFLAFVVILGNGLFLSGLREGIVLASVLFGAVAGSLLFILTVLLVRVFAARGNSGVHTPDSALGELTIGVSNAGSLYLLPKNSSRIFHLQFRQHSLEVESIDCFLAPDHAPLNTFTLGADAAGNLWLARPGGDCRMKITCQGRIVRRK